MTPEEQVAAFLAEHAYASLGGRCIHPNGEDCGWWSSHPSDLLVEDQHRAHQAAALLASPVLAEIRAAAATEALRDAADVVMNWKFTAEFAAWLRERADRVAPR